jgi:hypothetical protein
VHKFVLSFNVYNIISTPNQSNFQTNIDNINFTNKKMLSKCLSFTYSLSLNKNKEV